MPTSLTLTITDPVARLIVERSLAFARELQSTATASLDGRVLHNAESFCFLQGREFLRTSPETVVQGQADAVEKRIAAGTSNWRTGMRESRRGSAKCRGPSRKAATERPWPGC